MVGARMNLTDEQLKAVQCNDNALIVACPGSGKTRTLASKMLRCLDDVRDSSRHIACITYTNTAVYEIDHRLRKYGTTGDEIYCDISTIHSFCLNNILQFFYWRIPEYKNGFVVLPSDSERFREIAGNVCAEYGMPSTLRDNFELFNREPNGTPITTGDIEPEVALDFWNRLAEENFIDFCNIIYYSYQILLLYPSITNTLACRFAWILVDEFQDTSTLQVEILRLIAGKNKTKFFLVGDPYQSIYAFAGARPALMDSFADEIGAKKEFNLLINFRSSKPIIRHAELLCPRKPSMTAGGFAEKFNEEPLYIHCSNIIDGITEEFIPLLHELKIDYGQSAILSPWWIKLLHLGRQLRDHGIPIVGPGARPYKRNHLFALLAEQVCAYLENSDHRVFHHIEKELVKLVSNITGELNFKIYTYWGRIIVYRLIKCAKELREECNNGMSWLEIASEKFAAILFEADLLPRNASKLLLESVDGMKSDMIRQGVDIDNLTISDLGMFANLDGNMKLLTMHKAKGREFDAVAIIDLHEGKVPHYFSAKTQEGVDESRRLFYVSITRARRLLMYITDDEHWKNSPSRFLGKEGLDVA